MHVYYFDNNDAVDEREPHIGSDGDVSTEELKAIGVLAYHFDSQSDVDELAVSRNYVSRDVVDITVESMGGPESYAEKLKNFYTEHLHEDEEIRYILEGEGYFDVRGKDERWIRARLSKGDLLILPAGIYHRFTLTTDNYVRAMRLFKEQPKWVAINRPIADENPYRSEYLESISA